MFLPCDFQNYVRKFENDRTDENKQNIINYVVSYKNKLKYMCLYLKHMDKKNKNEYYKNLICYDLHKILLEDVNPTYSINENRTDEEYKNDIKEMYDKCQISGEHIKGCEIAHILEFKDCEDEKHKYNKFNGLVLNAQIHKYWDKGHLKIECNDDDKRIYFMINKDDKDIQYSIDNEDDNLVDCLLNLLFIKNINDQRDIDYNKYDYDSYSFFIKQRNSQY